MRLLHDPLICNWDFEYDEEEFKDGTGELDENVLYLAECDYLKEEGLDQYLSGLDGKERYDFLRNQLGIEIDDFGCKYNVEIPSAIKAIAFPKRKIKP